MKMQRMGMVGSIGQVKPERIPFGATKRGAGNLSVECPRRKKHSRGDLDFLVDGSDFPFPKGAPIRCG